METASILMVREFIIIHTPYMQYPITGPNGIRGENRKKKDLFVSVPILRYHWLHLFPLH